jgi:predicted anti-sigma-YlaC factor YlaD
MTGTESVHSHLSVPAGESSALQHMQMYLETRDWTARLLSFSIGDDEALPTLLTQVYQRVFGGGELGTGLSIETRLYRQSLLVALRHRRWRRKVSFEPHDFLSSDDSQTLLSVGDDIVSHLMAALQKLSVADRQLFALYQLSGFDFSRAVQITGLRTGQVKRRIKSVMLALLPPLDRVEPVGLFHVSLDVLFGEASARQLPAEVTAHLADCPECRERFYVVRRVCELSQRRFAAGTVRQWQAISDAVERAAVEAALEKPRRRWPALLATAALASAALAVLSTRNLPQAPPLETQSLPAVVAVAEKPASAPTPERPNETSASTPLALGPIPTTLSEGSVVSAKPGTSAVVDINAPDNIALSVSRGTLLVRAAHQPRKRFVVRTPEAEVWVVGTVFSVERKQQKTVVSVLEGQVDVVNVSGVKTSVQSGRSLVISQNSTQRRPMSCDAARDLRTSARPPPTSAVPNTQVAQAVNGGLLPQKVERAQTASATSRQSEAFLTDGPGTAFPSQAGGLVPGGIPPPPEATVLESDAPVLILPTYPEPAGTPQTRSAEKSPLSQPQEWNTQSISSAAPTPTPPSGAISAPLAEPVGTVAKGSLEQKFLTRAALAVQKAECLPMLEGLEDIASDTQRSEKTETARILSARCLEASNKPRQAVSQFRKYLTEYPAGAHVAEAKSALGEE